MNRSTLALATALLTLPTLFASAAQACISCEYTPEVVRSSSTTYEGPGSYKQQRSYTAEREYKARPAKRIAKETPPAPKIRRKVETAKIEVDKPAKVARTTAPAPAEKEVAAIEPVTVEQTESENSSISVAPTKVAEVDATPVASAKPVGCKKFFPAVGMTVSVPCE